MGAVAVIIILLQEIETILIIQAPHLSFIEEQNSRSFYDEKYA